MEVWELPWQRRKMEIRECDERGSPSSEITITQYANSLEKVKEIFTESANIKNVVRLPTYNSPGSSGRWSVTWREQLDIETSTTSFTGWNRRRKGKK